MVESATLRLRSAEEIAATPGGETQFALAPQRAMVFAERAMRLRQLARGHAMADFLVFIADLAEAQQAALAKFPPVPLPDEAALDSAARHGVPPLAAIDWLRDAAWRAALQAIVEHLRARAPAAVQPVLDRLQRADEAFLERQADALLGGITAGLDLAASPLLAAALQVYWTHMVAAVQERHDAHARAPHGRSEGARSPSGGPARSAVGGTHVQQQAWGRLDDPGICPACGSLPTASIVRGSSQRYLHCALCSLQWHLQRITCAHCGGTQRLAYQSLDAAGATAADKAEDASTRAAHAIVQAETCEDCGHYLKLVHADRDAFAEPLADDLATLTLDLLVAETGMLRHGVNLLLLFGAPEAEATPPPDPVGA